MTEKTLWIKDEHLQDILDGRKTIEIRVAYENILKLQSGDIVKLNDQYPYTIRWISIYDSFETLLRNEKPEKIAPGRSNEELLSLLREIYPPEKESLGVVAIHLRKGEMKGTDDQIAPPDREE